MDDIIAFEVFWAKIVPLEESLRSVAEKAFEAGIKQASNGSFEQE